MNTNNMIMSQWLKYNVNISKVMRCSRGSETNHLNISLNGDDLEEMEYFQYLGVDSAVNRAIGDEVCHRVIERATVLGALRMMWKKVQCLSRQRWVSLDVY